MPTMPNADNPVQRALYRAIAASCLIHLLILLLPAQEPPSGKTTLPPLQARLAPPLPPHEEKPAQALPPQPAPNRASQSRSRLMTVDKPQAPSKNTAPRWTAAQKAEMDGFLDELARTTPKTTLAQRSLNMAREQGRQLARQDDSDEAMLEARPNAPPPNPFSLETYLDGLVRRLNRSAGFVRNDPRSRGVKPAAVQFRLNPDGSMKSFIVLNAGDQADEIAFIKSVVERSLPFSPFPPDIDRAARSLGIIICIHPGIGDGGMGFTRSEGGRCR